MESVHSMAMSRIVTSCWQQCTLRSRQISQAMLCGYGFLTYMPPIQYSTTAGTVCISKLVCTLLQQGCDSVCTWGPSHAAMSTELQHVSAAALLSIKRACQSQTCESFDIWCVWPSNSANGSWLAGVMHTACVAVVTWQSFTFCAQETFRGNWVTLYTSDHQICKIACDT